MIRTIVTRVQRRIVTLQSRLVSQRGESLAEVLVAILISSLGMLMLASAISSSYSIVRQGRTATKRQYNAEEALADPASGNEGQVTIERVRLGNDTAVASESVDVTMVSESVASYDVFAYVPKEVTTP